jgi:FtsH-binding integral membrane protein
MARLTSVLSMRCWEIEEEEEEEEEIACSPGDDTGEAQVTKVCEGPTWRDASLDFSLFSVRQWAVSTGSSSVLSVSLSLSLGLILFRPLLSFFFPSLLEVMLSRIARATRPVRTCAYVPVVVHTGQVQRPFKTASMLARPKRMSRPPSPTSFQYQAQTHVSGFVSTGDEDYVVSNLGVSRFMSRVYTTTGVSFGASMGGAYALDALLPAGYLAENLLPVLGVGLIGALGSLVVFWNTSYTVATHREVDPKTLALVPVHSSLNSPSRKAAYVSFIAFETLILSPAVGLAHEINPSLVPTAIGLTGLVMGGATLFAKVQQPGALLSWQAPLFGGLCGLLGMSLAAMGTQVVLGPNAFTSLVLSVEPYAGIAIFTALTAYDTHAAISDYSTKKPEHLEAAINFYLNAINLFLRILKLISRKSTGGSNLDD